MSQQISYGSITIKDTTDWTDMTVLYYQSDSSSVAPASPTYDSNTNTISYNGWDDDPPAWKNEKYVWQLYMYIYKDDLETVIANVEFSDPVCLTGSDGSDGQMLYGKCTTAANVQEKVVVLEKGSLTLTSGTSVAVTFTNTNTANNPTLKVGSTTAKPIYIRNATLTSNSKYNWVANSTIIFIYSESGNNNNGCWQMDGTTAAATTATSYITDISSTGLKISRSNNASNYMNLNSNKMEMYLGGNKMFDIDTTTTDPSVTIGQTDSGKFNAYIDSDSFDVRTGTSTLATFGTETSIRTTNGIELAHFGYNEGNTESSTAISPYYTFGERNNAYQNYSQTSTYKIGDRVRYDGNCYVCIQNITVAESWTSAHWLKILDNKRGSYSMAEGYRTMAVCQSDHAEGRDTTAQGSYAHTEGYKTVAAIESAHTALSAHAEGMYTVALDTCAHAEGYTTRATGYASHAQNEETIANFSAQTAIGTFNIKDSTPLTAIHPSGNIYYGTHAFIIGNGTSDTARSNAFTVDWNGNVDIAGGITTNGGPIIINGREYGTNQILWTHPSGISNGYYMTTSHTATLTQNIDTQPNGIVLVWSSYANNTANNYDWYHHFIPKWQVLYSNGTGVTIPICLASTNGNGTAWAAKYVYVYNDKIVGYSGNNQGNSANFVLRAVIGV